MPWNCIANDSPSSRGGSRGSKYSTPSRISRAGVAALHQIEGAGHHAHVDALLGGAALDVANVALQGDEEPLP